MASTLEAEYREAPALDRGRLRRSLTAARTVVSNAGRDRLTGLGAEVAFFAALGLLPGLLALVALLGFIEGLLGQEFARRAQDVVLDLFRAVLTDGAGDAISGVRRLFAEGRPGLLTVGALASVLAFSRAFSTIFRALDIVYEVEAPHPWWRRRGRALGLAVVTLVMVAVLLTFIVLGPLLGRGQQVAESVGVGDGFALAWSFIRVPVTVTLLVGWATLVFSAGASRRGPWRRELPGALLVALFWLSASVGLRVFLAAAARTSRVFGVLGGALILLVWLYLLSLGLLLGAELNAALGGRGDRPSTTTEEEET